MSSPEPRADIQIVRLNEGFVMDYQGYTTAHTNADDLAERVRQVASTTDTGLQGAVPDAEPRGEVVTPELREATAVPSAASLGVVPTASLETEWANARKLIAFMAAGFDTQGKMFTRKDFDAALPVFAPHINPKEVEYELSEFLAGLHEDDD